MERAWIAASAASGVVDDGDVVVVDSCARRKRSGGRREQRALSSIGVERDSSQGRVVLVGRRSGRVVKGLSAAEGCWLLRDWRKFWTRAEVSCWGLFWVEERMC